MSSNAFSQTDTTKINQIQLTKPIARLVIKDLIKYDGLLREVESLNLLVAESNKKISTQAKLISNLETQNISLEDVIYTLNNKYETQERLTKEFETALKKQKRQTKLFKIGSIAGAVAVGLLIIK